MPLAREILLLVLSCAYGSHWRHTPSFARLMSQVIQFDDRYAHKKGILIPEIWFQDALEVFRHIFTFSKNLLEYIDYFSMRGQHYYKDDFSKFPLNSATILTFSLFERRKALKHKNYLSSPDLWTI